MYTIKDLSRQSKLSRSTLLYYDSLGLLKPSERSQANYRLYSEEALTTLERICLYREAGVSLAGIAELIKTSENDDGYRDILDKTLSFLNKEARKIRERQDIILKLLSGENGMSQPAAVTRRHLISESLSIMGADESSIAKLHAYLEKRSPKIHLDFLEVLGFSAEEIEQICERARIPTETETQ